MLIPPFGHVNVLEENIAIIGTEGGFALYHSGQLPMLSFIPRIYLSRINSGDTSEGSYRFTDPATAHMIIPAFRFKNNNISIAFAGGQFSEKRLLYKTRLDGFDPDWSDWTQKNTREYTNLPPGNYTFEIKALTLNGQTTPVLNYRFRILPPWYRTVYAMVIYLILLILFVAVGIRFMQYFMTKSRQKEQAALRARYLQREQQLKEEALVAEKEMIRLRNDALNLEMVHKEKELANSTMLIIQKNEILQKLREDMNRLKEQAREENLRNDLNTTIRRISREIDNEKQWQVFNTHVEQVHEDFFRIMKSRFPDLTPRELSLCAYLKMNISSKEIATLMNISTRGVEISRYRIRKKLNLDRNANLTEFMLGIQ
jgi:DNA-binding CsgD family transcriptional regulator